MGNDRFQIKALTLIQNILRHTRGPVQYTESVTLIIKTLRIGEIFCVLPLQRILYGLGPNVETRALKLIFTKTQKYCELA